MIALPLIGAASVASAEEAPQEPRALAAPADPKGGVNLGGISYYDRSRPFVDAIKSADVWGDPNKPYEDGKIPVDGNGWPKADFGIEVFNVQNPEDVDGVYKFSATFPGKPATAPAVSGYATDLTVKQTSYNRSTGYYTADVTMNSGGQMMMSVKNTAGGATNMKLIRPGYAGRSPMPTFTDSYLAHLNPFPVLRFMDITKTNGNPVKSWSNRTTKSYARQTVTGIRTRADGTTYEEGKGIAWEYVAELANATDSDAWINVPDLADENYVRQLARLMKAQLEPGRKVYVEWSNEVWNYVFTQTNQNDKDANAEVAAGDPQNLAYDDTDNYYYLGMRRVAQKQKWVGDIFAQEFGAGSLGNRVRSVFCSQIADQERFRQGLAYLKAVKGNPSGYLTAIASAPYFNLGETASGTRDVPGLTKQQILTYMRESAVGYGKPGSSLYQMKQLADSYGLKHMAYEGGQDVASTGNNIASKRAASLDPAMAGITTDYMNSWKNSGGSMFMYFFGGATTHNDQYGFWGLTDDITDFGQPKYTAYKAWVTG